MYWYLNAPDCLPSTRQCVMTRGTKKNLILSEQISTPFSCLPARTIAAFLGLLVGPGITIQTRKQPELARSLGPQENHVK